jgi:hypothetical protein
MTTIRPWAAFWQLDRNGSNPTPSHAGPSLLAAIPTMLRGTQSIDTAVYWSLTSCHSRKTQEVVTRFAPFQRGCVYTASRKKPRWRKR